MVRRAIHVYMITVIFTTAFSNTKCRHQNDLLMLRLSALRHEILPEKRRAVIMQVKILSACIIAPAPQCRVNTELITCHVYVSTHQQVLLTDLPWICNTKFPLFHPSISFSEIARRGNGELVPSTRNEKPDKLITCGVKSEPFRVQECNL